MTFPKVERFCMIPVTKIMFIDKAKYETLSSMKKLSNYPVLFDKHIIKQKLSIINSTLVFTIDDKNLHPLVELLIRPVVLVIV